MNLEYFNLYFAFLVAISADFPGSQDSLQQPAERLKTQEAVDSSCASSKSAKRSGAVEGHIWSILRF